MKKSKEEIELERKIENNEKEYEKLEGEYNIWSNVRQDSQALAKKDEIVTIHSQLNRELSLLKAKFSGIQIGKKIGKQEILKDIEIELHKLQDGADIMALKGEKDVKIIDELLVLVSKRLQKIKKEHDLR